MYYSQNQKRIFSKSFLFATTLLGSVFSMAQSKYSEIYNSTEFINQGLKLFENKKDEKAIFKYDKVGRPDMDYLKAQNEKAYSLFKLKKKEEWGAMLEKFRVSG